MISFKETFFILPKAPLHTKWAVSQDKTCHKKRKIWSAWRNLQVFWLWFNMRVCVGFKTRDEQNFYFGIIANAMACLKTLMTPTEQCVFAMCVVQKIQYFNDHWIVRGNNTISCNFYTGKRREQVFFIACSC